MVNHEPVLFDPLLGSAGYELLEVLLKHGLVCGVRVNLSFCLDNTPFITRRCRCAHTFCQIEYSIDDIVGS